MAIEPRRCLACGYEGEMKTWLGNYNAPQLVGCLLTFVYILPGIVFAAWAYGKYKCPQCGALDKSVKLDPSLPPAGKRTLGPSGQGARQEMACPWCAEQILVQAKVCKHCGRDVA
jgi:predicted RNA-binding Zn-ribbon protein involved in translation (DUF1610 family)